MYTIVDDGDEINIRATITQRWELAELVTKLQQRVDGLPVNLTTMILDPPSPRSSFEPDAQDVNQPKAGKPKELSNER